MQKETPGTRDRLIAAMSEALQRRGMNGVGLNEVLASAQAPKGVLYHHFPGGKTQLTVAAISLTVERMLARLDRLLKSDAGDPIGALQTWMTGAQKRLSETGYECGRPLATVALESTAEDAQIRSALSSAFGAIRARIAAGLQSSGQLAATAEGLAALIVAAYEGGLLQARVEKSLRPMVLVNDTLIALLEPYRGRRTPP